jgi:hypothetical protein
MLKHVKDDENDLSTSPSTAKEYRKKGSKQCKSNVEAVN